MRPKTANKASAHCVRQVFLANREADRAFLPMSTAQLVACAIGIQLNSVHARLCERSLTDLRDAQGAHADFGELQAFLIRSHQHLFKSCSAIAGNDGDSL